MRALVTGGAGFAGKHLVKRLQNVGYEVVSAGHGAQVGMDFRVVEQVEELVGGVLPEVVFHLAGTSSVVEMARDPHGGNYNVVQPAIHLMESMIGKTPTAVLVLVSTCHVYGRPPRLPIDEACGLAPVNLYGAARAAVEYMVPTYRQRGLDVRIARAFHHTGPGQDRRFALGDWAAQAEKGATRIPVGNLQVRRDYCDVRDVVEGYRLIAEKGAPNEVYNLCSGRAYLMEELFRMLCGPTVEPMVDPERGRKGEVPVMLGSASKLEALGWKREIPIERTLADLRASFRALPPAC